MRKANVFFGNRLAGYLYDLDDQFEFVYEKTYLVSGFPISVTLPLQEEPFFSKNLHPFFDGLIVEGWLLKTVEHNWKIDPNPDPTRETAMYIVHQEQKDLKENFSDELPFNIELAFIKRKNKKHN